MGSVESTVTRPGAGVQAHPAPGRWAELMRDVKKYKASYAFMAPFVIAFIFFTIIPLVTAVYLSFTYFNLLQPAKWIGLTNYKLLFLDDDIFLLSIKNTLIFAVISGPVSFAASFTLAWLINQLKARMLYTLAFYAPSITSGIAMSVVWLVFLSGDRYGYMNNFLISLGILNEPFLWMQDVRTILPAIIWVHLWMSLGSGFLVFLAGLQNVDPQLYEAGAIDGIKTKLQEAWFITLPLMKPQLLFSAVTAVVASFNVFQISVSLAGFPSTLYAGHTIVAHLYDFAFRRFEMGYSAAIAVVLFVVTYSLSRLLMKLLRSDE